MMRVNPDESHGVRATAGVRIGYIQMQPWCITNGREARLDEVSEIALEVGYGSLSSFVRGFHQITGCSPGNNRKANPG